MGATTIHEYITKEAGFINLLAVLYKLYKFMEDQRSRHDCLFQMHQVY